MQVRFYVCSRVVEDVGGGEWKLMEMYTLGHCGLEREDTEDISDIAVNEPRCFW